MKKVGVVLLIAVAVAWAYEGPYAVMEEVSITESGDFVYAPEGLEPQIIASGECDTIGPPISILFSVASSKWQVYESHDGEDTTWVDVEGTYQDSINLICGLEIPGPGTYRAVMQLDLGRGGPNPLANFSSSNSVSIEDVETAVVRKSWGAVKARE